MLSTRARPCTLLVLFAAVLISGAAIAEPARAPGTVFSDGPGDPQMVVIPAGRFLMGSSEAETTREARAAAPAAFEHPQHEVIIAKPFALGRGDVTVAQFDRFVKATSRRSVFDGCMVDTHGTWAVKADTSYLDPAFAQTANNPAVCVTWADAQSYAAWLSQQTGHRYYLPPEDQWEYAARGATTTARWWGDSQADLCAHANGADQSFDRAYPGDKQVNLSCDDGYAGSSPVGRFPANPFGLYDMIGNVWQWSGDCFSEQYGAPAAEPCMRRSIRGGSWHNYPNVLRAANRFWLPPTMRSSSLGFRVARELGS